MKPFRYRFSKLLNPVIVNRSGTNIRMNGFSSKGTFLLNIPPGKVEYVEIPVLTENEISTPEEAGNAASVEMKTVKAYTFFCVAGTEFAEGGDGSESNPWASVNYALNQLQPIVDCFAETYCCEYIQLRCSGVCNYTVRYTQKNDKGVLETKDFIGRNKFILRGLNVDITEDCEQSGYAIQSILESVFYSCNINIKNQSIPWYGFYRCYKSTFCYCTGVSESNSDSIFFNSCSNSSFYSCDVNIVNFDYDYNSYGEIFGGCSNSIFYLCKGNIENHRTSYGFNGCSNSTLYSCEITIETKKTGNFSGLDNLRGSAFLNCSNSVFYFCKSKVKIQADNQGENNVRSYGYYNNQLSYFFYCSSISEAFVSNFIYGDEYGFGFYMNSYSYFYSCSGEGYVSVNNSDYVDHLACGFTDNSDSYFFDCSTSPKICISNNVDCETFECDI